MVIKNVKGKKEEPVPAADLTPEEQPPAEEQPTEEPVYEEPVDEEPVYEEPVYEEGKDSTDILRRLYRNYRYCFDSFFVQRLSGVH